jgi:hypothetical protein
MILFIMAALGVPQGVFLDLGSEDGVNSNCANLALNFAWRGTSSMETNRTLRRAAHSTNATPTQGPTLPCSYAQ